jgi:hypothetical protein
MPADCKSEKREIEAEASKTVRDMDGYFEFSKDGEVQICAMFRHHVQMIFGHCGVVHSIHCVAALAYCELARLAPLAQ